MKISLVSTTDSYGGAAQAVLSLHKGLLSRGVDSQLVVSSKETQLPSVIEVDRPRSTLIGRAQMRIATESQRFFRRNDAESLNGNGKRFSYVSSPSSGYRSISRLLAESSVIQLNWVAEFLDWQSFFRDRPTVPLVWRLADMNPMTACCHYADDCDKFQTVCRKCPQQTSFAHRDLALQQFNEKKAALENLEQGDLTLVCQSDWMSSLAKSSALLGRFRRVVIPNGVDRNVFYPIEKWAAKLALGIEHDQPVALLCGFSGEPRKGLEQLSREIERSSLSVDQFLLLGQDDNSPWREDGWRTFSATQDRKILRLIYSAADLTVFPSLQDNCPNTVLESMACGTPVLAFDGSGAAEIVDATEGGWLVPNKRFDAVIENLETLLTSREELDAVSRRCVAGVTKHYDYGRMLDQYIDLYSQLSNRAVLGGFN